MKFFIYAIWVLTFCISFNCKVIAREVPPRIIPIPVDVSEALKKSMNDPFTMPWEKQPNDANEWRQLVRQYADISTDNLSKIFDSLNISCKESKIDDVSVFTLEPLQMPKENNERVLLYFHGGGYVFNPGKAGLGEGMYRASIGKFKVIAVDYRMAPHFPFPAALEDALKVYKVLLKSYSPKNIGVFGSSTGGGMTLVLCLLAKKENLPLPGAIAPGTPWSDLSKTGDSYFTNDHIDNILVSYDGLLEGMAKLYANGHDLKNPLISPVYGDMKGFPPAILGTGTRDLFLSNTVRVHRKLRETGVPADLLVLEGLSHWQYVLLPPDAPETQYYFKEVAKFFDSHLGK